MATINPFLRFRPNNGSNVAELGSDQDIDLSLADANPRGNNDGARAGTGAVVQPWGRKMTSDQVKNTNVVSIGKMRARALFPALGRVEAYWEGLRDGRLMPARAEVDPRGIADVLEHAFILETVAPGIARIRLAGMKLNDLMAMEVRGMPITAMFLPEARRELQKVTEQVLETPAVVRLTLGSDTGFTRPPLDGQMMLLPLRDAHGNATRILGVLETRGRIGRGPRRFMIRDIETKVIANDPLTRARPDIGGFQRLPEPGPALRPVAAEGATDRNSGLGGFAPRTAEFARRLAARAARTQDTPVPADDGRQPGHLRLVYDAEEV